MSEDGYRGQATIVAEDRELTVRVRLRGYFEPIDGRFHWYGRVEADPAVADLAAGRHVNVLVRTADGEASGSLADPDPWGRYRLTGVGRPPFLSDLHAGDLQASDLG